jgi:hypothetical protein
MKIYIASSFRNLNAVLFLRDCLRDAGHTVLDWTDKTPPPPDSMPLEERKTRFDTDESGAIFGFCINACASVDLVVYLGPAGQDAACEVGIAHCSGVPVYGFSGPLERPGLILNRCVEKWFAEPALFFEAVHELQQEITTHQENW